jgi:hypothetical protein
MRNKKYENEFYKFHNCRRPVGNKSVQYMQPRFSDDGSHNYVGKTSKNCCCQISCRSYIKVDNRYETEELRALGDGQTCYSRGDHVLGLKAFLLIV